MAIDDEDAAGRSGGSGGGDNADRRLTDADWWALRVGLAKVQERLELAGIPTQREESVKCCYARQTKLWAPDVDHNLWEIYTLDENVEHPDSAAIVPASSPSR